MSNRLRVFMADRPTRQEKCERKREYPRRQVALEQAALYRRHRGVEMRVYKCSICNRWRMTTVRQ